MMSSFIPSAERVAMVAQQFGRMFLLLTPSLTFASGPPCPHPGGEGLPVSATTQRFITQLGSEVPAERDEASRWLLDNPSESAVRGATLSTDAEVRRRATALLKAYCSRALERRSEQLRASARVRQVDRLTSQVLEWPGEAEDPRRWQPLFEACQGIWRDASSPILPAPDPDTWPAKTFTAHLDRFKPEFLDHRPPKRITLNRFGDPVDKRFLVCGREVVLDGCVSSVFVCDGGIRATRSIDCFVLVNGSATLGGLRRCLVLADGDVRLNDSPSECLVIARGDVTCEGLIGKCVIMAGKSIHLSPDLKAQQSIFQAGQTVQLDPKSRLKGCTIKEKQAEPFGSLSFFEVEALGGTALASTTPPVLRHVRPDTPFARAGLRDGDHLVAVGQREVTSPESFRRLLRSALSRGSEAGVVVRRAGELRCLTVRTD